MYFRKANDDISPAMILKALTATPDKTVQSATQPEIRVAVLLYLYLVFNVFRAKSSGKASPKEKAKGEALLSSREASAKSRSVKTKYPRHDGEAVLFM